MRRLSSILALMLLLITAAPVLACMTESAMSHEESACCRAMHGNCQEMASMGCCRKELRADEHPQIATTSLLSDIHWTVIHWLTPAVAPNQFLPSALDIPAEHSPPGLRTAKTAVLRI